MNSRVGKKLREKYRRHKPVIARRASFMVLEAGKKLQHVSRSAGRARMSHRVPAFARAGSRGMEFGRGFSAPKRTGPSKRRVSFEE